MDESHRLRQQIFIILFGRKRRKLPQFGANIIHAPRSLDMFQKPWVKLDWGLLHRRREHFKVDCASDILLQIHICCRYTIAFSPSVLIKCGICPYHPLVRTVRMNGSRKRSTAHDT